MTELNGTTPRKHSEEIRDYLEIMRMHIHYPFEYCIITAMIKDNNSCSVCSLLDTEEHYEGECIIHVVARVLA